MKKPRYEFLVLFPKNRHPKKH